MVQRLSTAYLSSLTMEVSYGIVGAGLVVFRELVHPFLDNMLRSRLDDGLDGQERNCECGRTGIETESLFAVTLFAPPAHEVDEAETDYEIRTGD